MGDTRFRSAEKGRNWQSSTPAKRPRNEYEDEYDRSLSGVNVNRREKLRRNESISGDRLGVHSHPPAPPLTFLDDHSLRGDQADATPFLDDHAQVPKWPRYEYEYDCSLYGVNANRREDPRYTERGGDRLGFRDRGHSPPPTFLDNHTLWRDEGQARAPHFLDDRPFLRDRTVDAPPSNGLTVSRGPVNFRSDSHRLDPVIEGRLPVDEHYSLPADASSTLFVEGLPNDCTSREAAHIFRHFRGFKEVRIVNKSKEPKKAHVGGERGESVVVALCFVEFDNPKCAATAMACVQGYMLDENDRDSPSLKLQFARSTLKASNRDRNASSFARDQDRDEYRRRQ